MKKYISIFLLFFMVLYFSVTVFAENREDSLEAHADVYVLAEEQMVINGSKKEYAPFVVDGIKIQLYTETLMTADEAMDLYYDAYKMCAEMAAEYGLTASIDDKEFCDFAKTHAAMNENGSEEFISQCMEFAKFLDYYENAELNRKILSLAAERGENWAAEIDSLMPHYRSSTSPADNSDLNEAALHTKKEQPIMIMMEGNSIVTYSGGRTECHI